MGEEGTFDRRRPLLVLVALTAVGALVRFAFLSAESLWIDEGWSAYLASGSLADVMRRSLAEDVHPPLLHLLQWPIPKLGNSEFLLRLPTAILGTAAIPAIYAAGRRLASPRVGLVAAALLAASPFAVHVSRDARYYAPLLLFSILSLAALLRLQRKGKKRDAARLAVANALILYTQYMGAFFVAAVLLAALCGTRRARRMAVLSGLITAILFLPGLFLATRQFSRVMGGYWIPAPDLEAVGETLAGLVALGPHPDSWPPLSGWLPALLFLGVLAAGIRLARREPGARLMIVLFALPIAGVLLVSAFRPLFLMRTLTPALPPFLLLAALVVVRARRPLAVTLLLVAALLPGTIALHAGRYKEDWRGAYRDMAARIEPGEPVLTDSFKEKTYRFYVPRHERLARAEWIEVSRHTPIEDVEAVMKERDTFWYAFRTCDGKDVDAARRADESFDRTFVYERNAACVIRFRRR